ncbi:hypothetical protein RSSM_00641 [Rhodopirellula sallentina SM41]|uniref:Uncharacterized protein n=1 Tax=Rhodopirellula sallentina SM41 TaxID=1263870 RepID=M5U9E9_9BACT|nr:hypothetical protein RSSM_00641 [Rhodopirellula sallentina SM41]
MTLPTPRVKSRKRSRSQASRFSRDNLFVTLSFTAVRPSSRQSLFGSAFFAVRSQRRSNPSR